MSTEPELSTADMLRAWARGLYPNEAAVEMLLRAFGGRFALAGNPWIKESDADEDWLWVDPLALATSTGALSGGERRFLKIVGSLLDEGAPVALGDVLPGLDRKTLTVVLAGMAHAAGSHQHSAIQGRAIVHLDSLYPWPEVGA